jgi:hypothetical protein
MRNVRFSSMLNSLFIIARTFNTSFSLSSARFAGGGGGGGCPARPRPLITGKPYQPRLTQGRSRDASRPPPGGARAHAHVQGDCLIEDRDGVEQRADSVRCCRRILHGEEQRPILLGERQSLGKTLVVSERQRTSQCQGFVVGAKRSA